MIRTTASLSGKVCGDIRRRIGDGSRVPLKRLDLNDGFRVQVDDTTSRLVIIQLGDPTTREEIGYTEYDSKLPGTRWYLSPEWRQGVKLLLCRLGMYDSTTESEAVPF
jgi:hypothetical protein